ncbi:PGF-pre-PGF domain-containing protein, partial [Candidatus Woesearchaeota archaeon]|nr:PGF-pre-PGF domain-containing protein [Candidatus Woesearchaeota archaeon]
IMQDITVEHPLNVDIKANVWSQSISPCQKAVYDLTIINPETFSETYTFAVDKFSADTTFSKDSITLQANTSEDLTIEIQPKKCSLIGEYNIPFLATAEKTGTMAELSLQLEITDTGMPVIAEGIDTIKSEILEESAVNLDIFNKHTESKTYILELDGPTWVSTDTKMIVIEAEEREKFPLYLKPTQTVEPGEYSVKIKATDVNGAEFSKEILIKLRKSTVLSKLFGDYLVYTISGIILLLILIVGIYFVVNKLTDEKAVKARAKRRKERAKKKEALKKQQEKDKKLREQEKQKKDRAIEKERQKAVKKYEKKLKAEYELISKDDIATGKRVHDKWLFNMILFFVVLILLYIGFKTRTLLMDNKYYVLLGVAILIVLFILYRISRLTKSVARWRGLTLANETILMHLGWRKGLHQLSFKIDSPAKNIKVVAKKGRTRHAKYTHPKDFVYRYFRVTSSVQNVDIKESKFRFRVSRQWMKRRGIKPEDISLAMLKYTGYTKLKAIREGSDKNYVYYKANAEGFGQFAIVGKTSAKERYKSRWIAILALIILAVLAGGITAVLTADQPIQVKGIPQQMWDQDLQHSL